MANPKASVQHDVNYKVEIPLILSLPVFIMVTFLIVFPVFVYANAGAGTLLAGTVLEKTQSFPVTTIRKEFKDTDGVSSLRKKYYIPMSIMPKLLVISHIMLAIGLILGFTRMIVLKKFIRAKMEEYHSKFKQQ